MYLPKQQLIRITRHHGIPVLHGAALTRQDSHHRLAALFQVQYPHRPALPVPAQEAAALRGEAEAEAAAADGERKVQSAESIGGRAKRRGQSAKCAILVPC